MDQLMEWPSKRIPHGGALHNPKVKYSQGTQDLLKTLMEESKLTLRQQQQVDWCLRSGSSLADVKNRSKPSRVQSAPASLKNPPKISRRRSYSAIKKSGDFEIDRFVPSQRNEDREVLKNRLQDIMEYGKDQDHLTNRKIPKSKSENKISVQKKKLPGKYEILQDLLSRIKERTDWLQEMEAVGEGVKHREIIQHQIAEIMRTIDSLNLPKNIMDLKIEDDESSETNKKKIIEKKTNKDLESPKSTVRSEKKSNGKINVNLKNMNKNKKEIPKSNMMHNKRENIADILYTL